MSSATRPGGAAFYAAEVYRRLGADVHVATVVGEDFAHDEALAGCPHWVVRRGRTTTFSNVYTPAGARIQLVDAVAPAVTPERLPVDWRDFDVVHLAPIMGEVDISAWRAAVSARRWVISVQGWLRRLGVSLDHAARVALVGAEAAAWARGRQVLPRPWPGGDGDGPAPRGRGGPGGERGGRRASGYLDAALLSEEDLAGQGALLDRLRAAAAVVVLTAGVRGAVVYERDPCRATRVGVFPAREVDATGAGDTFAAAFSVHYGASAAAVEAARFGAAAASIAIEAAGTDALDRLSETHARAGRVPILGPVAATEAR
ncbi:PfkB family carbohydrate kinase [Haliangium sp.]|uniref:PfkB family carbohydrate kinase n=1 Tax=Haliangium sp. TaxID=2663208 RepID=UPI003D0987AF